MPLPWNSVSLSPWIIGRVMLGHHSYMLGKGLWTLLVSFDFDISPLWSEVTAFASSKLPSLCPDSWLSMSNWKTLHMGNSSWLLESDGLCSQDTVLSWARLLPLHHHGVLYFQPSVCLQESKVSWKKWTKQFHGLLHTGLSLSKLNLGALSEVLFFQQRRC